MKHSSFSLLLGTILFALPFAALAHEHRVFTIGDKQYSIAVGMMNEPVAVDDKSGVEVIVQQLNGDSQSEDSDDGPSGTPVEGLESTLKVEVSAGDAKKTFDVEPEDGNPGVYEAAFHPTVQTTYSFRLTGTINDTPIDVTYDCNPAGHTLTAEDTTPVKLSDAVTQTQKGGSFGCPVSKDDVSFPEHTATMVDLTKKAQSPNLALPALVLSVLALISTGGVALRKRP